MQGMSHTTTLAAAARDRAWKVPRVRTKPPMPGFHSHTLSHEPPLDSARVTPVNFLISDEQVGAFQLEVVSGETTGPGSK